MNRMPSILDDRTRVRAQHQRLSNSPRKSSLMGVKPRTSALVVKSGRKSLFSRGKILSRPPIPKMAAAPLADEPRPAKRTRISGEGALPVAAGEEKATEVVDLSPSANKRIEIAVTASKRKSVSKGRMSHAGQRRRSSVGRQSIGKNAILGTSKWSSKF